MRSKGDTKKKKKDILPLCYVWSINSSGLHINGYLDIDSEIADR